MTGQKALTLTDRSFDRDVLQSEVSVLVDFWGEGCPPCREMAPTVDTIAQEYAGRVKVGRLDVGSNGNSSKRYNIRGIPTLLLFRGGRGVEPRVGAVGKQEVRKMLDSHLDV